MPLLEELSRRIIAQLPTFLGGMPEGYAESRLSHTPMQVVPNDQWGQVQQQQGVPPAYGFTQFNAFGQPHTFVPQREFTGPFTGDLPGPGGPPGTIPRHEAIHAFLGPVENKLDLSKIAALVGQSGLQHLYGMGYKSPADQASEIAARLTTDPASLGMSVDTGKDAMRKYIEMLRQQDPSRATRLSKYLGLSGSEKGDGVAELQRPNDTF